MDLALSAVAAEQHWRSAAAPPWLLRAPGPGDAGDAHASRLRFRLAADGGAGAAACAVWKQLAGCPGAVRDGHVQLRRGGLAAAPGRGRAYRLRAELHRGPRSRVWRAELLPEGRPAVLKVILTDGPGRLEAARQERRLTQRLAAAVAGRPGGGPYAHWVRLLESWEARAEAGGQGVDAAGAAEAPRPVVCLALAPLHQSAAAVLAHQGARGRRGLSPGAVRCIARQALLALDALHRQQRVVHRDVKPSNILLAQPLFVPKAPATRGRPAVRSLSRAELAGARWVLADLGSAAPLRPALGWARPALLPWARVPAVRWEAGGEPPYETPAYSPPEAVLQLPATPAWDVWSLGCTLFETATGTVLFGGLEQAAAALAGADGGSSSSDGEAAGGAAWRWRGAAGSATARRRARLEALSDAAHLALVRRLLGPPPLGVLERSPLARAFYDDRGEPLRPLPGRKGLEQRLVEAGALDAAQASDLACFLGLMLRCDPDARPSARELLAHPWLRDD